MVPLREIAKDQFEMISSADVRKVGLKDFLGVLADRKPIVGKGDMAKYQEK